MEGTQLPLPLLFQFYFTLLFGESKAVLENDLFSAQLRKNGKKMTKIIILGEFWKKVGLGKITSLLSTTFRPIFIAINQKNSGNSFVTLYVQQDLN
jgi:hypothetical protein